jgi:hypothetical protein
MLERTIAAVAVVGVVVAGALHLLATSEGTEAQAGQVTRASSSKVVQWQRVPLDHGKVRGIFWGVGARVPKGESLDRICMSLVIVPPPPPGQDYVESDETVSCGTLRKRSESVGIVTSLGSSESETSLIAAVYPNAVRRVELVLRGGGREVARTMLRRAKRSSATAVPNFRYLVLVLDAGECIERTITYDRRGEQVQNTVAEPGC